MILGRSLNDWILLTALFASSTLCTLFDFHISDDILLNLSIVTLTMAFYFMNWMKGMLVLVMYVLAQTVFSIFQLSKGLPSLEAVKTVLLSLPQPLLIIIFYALIMGLCSIWAKRRTSAYRIGSFILGLLLYATSDYAYVYHLNKLPQFNMPAFVCYIFAFLFLFVIAARMVESNLEKRRAESEVKRQENAYLKIVEDSPEAIAISIDRQWAYVNPALVQLFGGSCKEELLAVSSYAFVHPDYIAMNQSRLTRVEHGATANLEEQVLLKLNGESFVAETISIPTVYNGQSAVHTVIRDVTYKKEQQELIVQTERFRMAGQLAAGIAHEIRNPVTAIKGLMKLFRTQPKTEYVDIITDEITRIEDITTELLLLTKSNKAQYCEADIMQALCQIVTLLEPQAHMKNIAFVMHDHAETAIILCDVNKLKQAFINFLKNAIEAMPEGGTITVRTTSRNDTIQIEILDQGVGISTETLKKLGDPFFTTKESGTGLGFMVSKKIIEDHNGQLAVTSQVGRGTSVRIILPLSTALN